jgi:hypothetical protein
MENTIVFLTLALFAYSPRDNAWLFLFNGACMIFAQGLARQLVKRLGQRKVVILGMLIAAIAFVGVALIPTPTPGTPSPAWSEGAFYLGLGLISFATGLILPSVSALVSLYSGADEQGRNLGILRSAGSLARVIGPVTAALLYFHFGSHFWVYLGGALLMLPAIWIVRGLPDPESERLKACGSGQRPPQRVAAADHLHEGDAAAERAVEMESGLGRFRLGERGFPPRLVDPVLGDGPLPPLDPFLLGSTPGAERRAQFRVDQLTEFGVRQPPQLGMTRAPDEARQQDLAGGRPARQGGRREEAAQQASALFARDQETKTVQRMLDRAAVIAARDDGDGRRLRPLPVVEEPAQAFVEG